ncbi:MAG TPA: hypothetical protein VG164_03120 [Trebonia sp.]|jgi:hypothetical protein|nr:hypothetical protein [Trebonia sp.]
MTPEELTTGLRKWTQGHDLHVRAAVELLISHGYWLHRDDFAAACTETFRGETSIDWTHAREFAEEAPGCSTLQRRLLLLAAAIGGDDFGLSKTSDQDAKAIIRAVTTAVTGTDPEAAGNAGRDQR